MTTTWPPSAGPVALKVKLLWVAGIVFLAAAVVVPIAMNRPHWGTDELVQARIRLPPCGVIKSGSGQQVDKAIACFRNAWEHHAPAELIVADAVPSNDGELFRRYYRVTSQGTLELIVERRLSSGRTFAVVQQCVQPTDIGAFLATDFCP